MAEYIKLDPGPLTALRTVNPRLISCNVKMTSCAACAFIVVCAGIDQQT